MGKVLPEEDDLLELPAGTDGDDEGVGTADAADLVLAEIAEGPEDIGLDADTATETGDAALEIENEDTGTAWALDEAPIEMETELDVEGDEHGWTHESEGSAEGWDDELPADDESGALDDGGLEGVDDPMLDGLDAEDEVSAISEEDEDDLPEDLGEDLAREISP